MKTAKIGSIFIVAVMALTAIGAAYAHWEETIKIEGKMTTDNIDVYFDEDCSYTNDPWNSDEFEDIQDPDECGVWELITGVGYEWDGERRNKNVGWCNISVPDDNDNLLNIEIFDAYPCYYAHPFFCIKNRGSCPVQVYGVRLINVSEGDQELTLDPPLDLVPCTPYFIEVYEDAAGDWKYRIEEYEHGVTDNASFDFSIHLTGEQWAQGTQLDPDYWTPSDDPMHVPCAAYVGELFGDICIHMENNCSQLTDYDFEIDITFWNWPELPEP
jgi:hypothetical protein